MENTPEFLEFVKKCRENSPQISFPTIEIYWEQQKSNPVNETNQDEKTTPKKSKK